MENLDNLLNVTDACARLDGREGLLEDLNILLVLSDVAALAY